MRGGAEALAGLKLMQQREEARLVQIDHRQEQQDAQQADAEGETAQEQQRTHFLHVDLSVFRRLYPAVPWEGPPGLNVAQSVAKNESPRRAWGARLGAATVRGVDASGTRPATEYGLGLRVELGRAAAVTPL